MTIEQAMIVYIYLRHTSINDRIINAKERDAYDKAIDVISKHAVEILKIMKIHA